eukprot:316150_1
MGGVMASRVGLLLLRPIFILVSVYSNFCFIYCHGFALPLNTGILERHHQPISRPLSMASQIPSDAACPPLPSEAAKQTALYEMVYVERLPDTSKLASGLFLPGNEMPRMHICRVLSVGQGREAENGSLVPNQGIKVDDLVYVKDPWGIGPRDEEISGQKFSFVRYSSICAKIPDKDGSFEMARRGGE